MKILPYHLLKIVINVMGHYNIVFGQVVGANKSAEGFAWYFEDKIWLADDQNKVLYVEGVEWGLTLSISKICLVNLQMQVIASVNWDGEYTCPEKWESIFLSAIESLHPIIDWIVFPSDLKNPEVKTK